MTCGMPVRLTRGIAALVVVLASAGSAAAQTYGIDFRNTLMPALT